MNKKQYVYVVIKRTVNIFSYSDAVQIEIDEVFDTRDKAQEYINKMNVEKGTRYDWFRKEVK